MTSERRRDTPPLVPAWLDPLPTLGLAADVPSQCLPDHLGARSADDPDLLEDHPPTPGWWSDRDGHLRRLRRIERQVRGLQRMIDQDVAPVDILSQVAAVARALQSVAVGLLDEHLRSWFTNAADQRDAHPGDMIDEATRAIESILRP